MKGFCEFCGRYPGPLERVRGRGLTRQEGGLYLCPDCQGLQRAPGFSLGAVSRSFSELTRRGSAPVAVVIIAMAILVGVPLSVAMFAPGGNGGVQGVAQRGPSPLPSEASTPAVAHSAHPSGPGGAAAPSSRVLPASAMPSPTATDEPAASRDQATPAFSLGEAAVRTWQGPYGETRLQVIVPVRNDDARWLALPRSTSTYRIVDQEGRGVASGVFTAALPATVGPGETGYLVDTVSVTFVDPTDDQSVEADVRAMQTDAPVASISVSELSAATSPAGGLRVTGQVRNDGTTATQWIMVGAVALAQDGTPLGAVYDPTDIGRLEPGEVLAFDTEYPGAPPPSAGVAADLIGMAFETLP